jgi:hypothetical protein
MLSKIFICPYFGELPSWFDLYLKNFERLKRLGYELLLDQNEAKFRQRVGDKLGVVAPPFAGSRKLSDLRVMLGELYREEISDYQFWGLTDFDCVYGRVDRFISDEQLADLDIHSNHFCYIAGPWTLFRNTPYVNSLFREYPGWQEEATSPRLSGWGEKAFSKLVDARHDEGKLRRLYTHFQSKKPTDLSAVHFEGDALYDGDDEIMMAHFNRSKVYPCHTRS